ncbi:adipokinetic hormone/corazonin-related peptide receptor variant I-like [Macrosteles quadrilineatus]|uniref:adipokinetic hormone/corazonin-related peptide receptor variant I-like n=1 Tax=Macrosteles quadrilineatus TaxID=74068 RepID=UPI0023E1394D|nr:adipokinetic hormone/corazonin-related peptide receptor variant I-like [Macrosteles quadrilineatus]
MTSERRLTDPDLTHELNNSTLIRELPPELKFNSSSLVVVVIYSVLFLVASVGNVTVFVSLVRSRRRKSRVTLMMTHLSIADMIVTFFMIPLEICWRITTQWIAGNFACKFLLFFRAFGLYLSSNVLVCISLDRYFAVLHPLKVTVARRRGKLMLVGAWTASVVCSLPQSVVFHVAQHPEYPEFSQCVSFDYFSTPLKEKAYNFFCLVVMYFLPLVVITFAYTCILFKILSKTRENRDDMQRPEENSTGPRTRMRLRRNDTSVIERARAKTIRMSVTIVAAFVWCWTPYVVMTMWYIIDRKSAEKVDSWVQDALFVMAVANSCVNPLVYGSYAFDCPVCWCHCKSCSGSNRQTTDAQGHPLHTEQPSPGHKLNINNNSINKSFPASFVEARSHSCTARYTDRIKKPAVSHFHLDRIHNKEEIMKCHSDPGREIGSILNCTSF